MAATQKHKLKRSIPSEGMSKPKIRNMYLPPSKLKDTDAATDMSNNSGVQIFHNNYAAPVHVANNKYDGLQLQNAENEEQDGEYTYEFLDSDPNDPQVELENEENNNEEGEEDRPGIHPHDRPEVHPHDPAVCCMQESLLELDSDTTRSSLEAYKSLHKNTDENNQSTSPSILDSLRKRPKQSRFAFYPVKNNEKMVLSSTTLVNNTSEISEISEDVIYPSPTQRSVASKVKQLWKLKRKIPVKHIDFGLCPSPEYTSTQMEDNKSVMNTAVINTLKDNINTSCLSPIKMHNKTDIQIKKTIEAQKKDELLINKVKKNKLIKNINNFACEDETFYLPAEQAANTNNDMDNFILDDTENKPPKKKMLLDNCNVWSKRKDIPKQLNMRCKADRAKLNGQDCWECREYYKSLELSKEELQKRKNQCSRHRHKYERPNTPEGFWDPEFPETLDDCREDRERFENMILRKVNELVEVVGRNDNPVGRTGRDYALLPQMPFNDINALQRFDRDLKDNGQMRDQFMRKIEDIGGKSVQKAVKYAMEVVMTDDLTQQVVWTLGAENKPKISKFTFPYVIIDVVRNAFDGTKIKTVEDRIAEWLRRGGDRIKIANKRRERQHNLQQ